MRKFLAAMLIAATAVIGYGVAPTSASTGPQRTGRFVLCDNPDQRSFLCLQRNGGTGTKITNQPAANVAKQNITEPFLNICNGGHKVIVSPTFCPFKNHSLDTRWKGANIREICFAELSGCVGLNGSLTVNQPKSGGTGTTWIVSGTRYVSRSASDSAGATRYLTATRAAGGEPYAGKDHQALSEWQGRQF